jgi:hypothetical protein
MRSTIGSRGAWLAVKRRKHWSHTAILEYKKRGSLFRRT